MNAAAIRLLIAKGLDASDIAEVAEALERKRDNTAAERQARHRAKKRGESNAVMSRRDPLLEEIITPVQPSPDGEVCTPKRKSSPMHSLPEDWTPILTHAAERLIERWEPGRLERAVNAFRDHAADKGRKSRDWQAAFRKWLENDEKWNPSNGHQRENIQRSNGASPDRRSSLARAIDEGLDNLDWIARN